MPGKLNSLYISRIFIILFLIFSFQPARAESDEIDRMILRGLDRCYHFKWDEGEKIFQSIIKKHSDDPRGYHYTSTIYLWYYLSTNDKNDYENFLHYSNLTVDKSESLLNIDPEDIKIKYILGTNYSCRAMIFTKAGNYLDAIWASKSSESYLGDVIKINPANYDAYLGLGLYNFAVDQIPSAFKWALNLAGISGSENTGLNYIKNTAEKGTFSAVEAQFYLSQILSEVKIDYNTSGLYLKRLAAKYPDNLLFNYSLGVLEIKKRNPDQAKKYISKVLKAGNGKFKQLNAFSNFLMGDILFRKNKYEEASVYYQSFLSLAANEDYTGIAAYRLAVCLEMSDDRNSALNYFNLSLNGNTDLDDDNYARRKGTFYTERAMTKNEKDLIRFSNMIEEGLYENAADSLKDMLNNKLAEKIRAEVYLYLSEAEFNSGNNDESVKYAGNALDLNPGEEKWIHPFACYYAARGYKEINDTGLMMKYIEEAEDYSNYDYSNKLENLLESLK